jgi:predicted ArsR family transcriptional regulator
VLVVDSVPPSGPQASENRALGVAALRVLRVLVAAGGPLTVAELTAEIGGHPNTIREHLQNLFEGGLATQNPQAPTGRGRPSIGYSASTAGSRIATAGSRPLVDDAFVDALAEHLGEAPRPGVAAVAIGRRWGERLGVGRGYPSLILTLAAQGFVAERSSEGLAIRTCPLLDSARKNPDVVCGLHQGLMDSLAPEPLTLAPFARPGVCLAVAPHA